MAAFDTHTALWHLEQCVGQHGCQFQFCVQNRVHMAMVPPAHNTEFYHITIDKCLAPWVDGFQMPVVNRSDTDDIRCRRDQHFGVLRAAFGYDTLRARVSLYAVARLKNMLRWFILKHRLCKGIPVCIYTTFWNLDLVRSTIVVSITLPLLLSKRQCPSPVYRQGFMHNILLKMVRSRETARFECSIRIRISSISCFGSLEA